MSLQAPKHPVTLLVLTGCDTVRHHFRPSSLDAVMGHTNVLIVSPQWHEWLEQDFRPLLHQGSRQQSPVTFMPSRAPKALEMKFRNAFCSGHTLLLRSRYFINYVMLASQNTPFTVPLTTTSYKLNTCAHILKRTSTRFSVFQVSNWHRHLHRRTVLMSCSIHPPFALHHHSAAAGTKPPRTVMAHQDRANTCKT